MRGKETVAVESLSVDTHAGRVLNAVAQMQHAANIQLETLRGDEAKHRERAAYLEGYQEDAAFWREQARLWEDGEKLLRNEALGALRWIRNACAEEARKGPGMDLSVIDSRIRSLTLPDLPTTKATSTYTTDSKGNPCPES